MKRSFVHSAFLLMAAALINRIMGFVYQAVIYRLIGPEGVGLFNLVYPVYVLFVIVATAGIPLGISKLVSEEEARGNHRESYQILWLSVLLLTFSGSVFFLLAFICSPLLIKFVFVNKAVGPVFLSLLPGIFVISLSSGFRGFFQGLMNMAPPALSQVIEQIVRIVIGMCLITLLLPKGTEWAASGLAAASVLGEFVGLSVLLLIFFKKRSFYGRFSLPSADKSLEIMRKMFNMCAPITLGRIAATVMLSVDSILIPLMLKKAGFTISQATALYGQLTSVALTLLYVPSVITVSLATSLVPAISDAVAQERSELVRTRTSEAVRVTLLAGIPFTVVFMTLSSEITGVVYGSPQSGHLLYILSLGGIAAYLQQTTTGILQGLGKPSVPLKNMIIGSVIKAPVLCVLTSDPGFGVAGCAYAYNLLFYATAFLNLVSLYRATGFQIGFFNSLWKPAAAGVISAFTFREVYTWVDRLSGINWAGVFVSLVTGFAVYLLMLIISGAVKDRDLSRIPFFNRLIRR